MQKDGLYLKSRSVKPITVKRYTTAAELFEAWCKRKKLSTATGKNLDIAFAKFFDHLFFQGAAIEEARYTAWGVRFVRSISIMKRDYPRLHESLNGWKNAAPNTVKDPITWEALLILCDTLLQVKGRLAKQCRQAALIAPIQFDGYFRPGEVFAVRLNDIIVSGKKEPGRSSCHPGQPRRQGKFERRPSLSTSGS